MRKLIAIILVLAMLLPAAAFAEGGSSEWLTALEEKNLKLNDQTELFTGWYENGDALLAENYMVYEPGEDVQPLVCFGNDVAGAAGFSRITEIEAEQGNHVLAGINGDYFTMATGVAMGFIIKNGRVCSSERSGCESVGFHADGSVVIGSPGLNVSVTNETTGYSAQQLCFNKDLSDSDGLVVYSKDFGATNGAGKHTSLVLVITDVQKPEGLADDPQEEPEESEEESEAEETREEALTWTVSDLVPGCTVSAVVETIEALDSAKALEDGRLVLSINDSSKYVGALAAVKSMKVGDSITVSFSVDEAWTDVVNAMGVERRLLTNGAVSENILDDVAAGEDDTRDPRTALGIRKDGSLVLYTADGRSTSHSSGLTYYELARRLWDLGCVDAVNLDGGGSTQIYVSYPGDESVTHINKTSGSSVRRCADYLCLVNKAQADGELAAITIYPYQARVLAGATLPLTLKGTDEGWYPVDISSSIPVWKVTKKMGTIENNSFVAGSRAGTATVEASIGRVTGTAEIEVITRPDELTVSYEDGSALPERLYLYSGTSVSLKAGASYKRQTLISDENCFTWAVSEGLGTVENGQLTAVDLDSEEFAAAGTDLLEGFLTVTAGEVSKSIPVTVYKDDGAPVISGEISGNLLMASVKDERDRSFGKANISVRLDGQKISFTYTDSGDVYATLPDADGKLHHVVIEAADSQGNKARLGLEVPAVDPASNPDGSEFVRVYEFSDLGSDNPLTPYAEYLRSRGLMLGKLNSGVLVFDAEACLTRQEFASVICNVLGYDTADYEGVELPFTDNETIAAWAVPCVQAVYAEGRMLGRANSDGTLCFDPQGKITRQEVLTVFARLLGDGYKSAELSCTDAASVADWALPYVELALSNGVVDLKDGLLRPLDNISRGELALMLYAMD